MTNFVIQLGAGMLILLATILIVSSIITKVYKYIPMQVVCLIVNIFLFWSFS